MSEFQKWTSQHRTIRASRDWNALLDHGLEKPASYIIRKNGSYVEAINGSTGTIDYGGANDAGGVSGSDASAVIQSAIDALPDGGTIVIRRGTYNFDSGLTLKRYIHLKGEGWGSTIFKFTHIDAPCINIDVDMYEAVEISDLWIDGNKSNTHAMIYGENMCNSAFRRLMLQPSNYYYAGDGIDLNGAGFGPYNNIIEDVIAVACRNGITIRGYCYEVLIARPLVNYCTQHGVEINYRGATIIYPILSGNTLDGIHVESSADPCVVWILGGFGDVNQRDDLSFQRVGTGKVRFSIVGFRSRDAGRYALYASHTKGVLNGLYVHSPGVAGLKIEAYSALTAIHSELSTVDIDATSSFRAIYCNVYTTTSDVATIPSGQSNVTVNHSLIAAPKVVLLTGTHDEVKECYVTNVTDTQFTINAPTPVTADRDVYWRASIRELA